MTKVATIKKAKFFSAKVLGTLALGVMLLTAVALPGGIRADHPASPQVDGPAKITLGTPSMDFPGVLVCVTRENRSPAINE